MSRAADYIAAVEAEGHTVTLVRGAFSDGHDAICTNFYPGGLDNEPTLPPDPDAAMRLTYDLRPRDEAEKQELREELIKRGMVQ